jgi:transposase
MTELEKLSAIKMRNDGIPVPEIAKHFNETQSYIYYVTADENVDRRRKVNEDKKPSMRELFLSGVSVTKIAKKFGITHTTATLYLRDLIQERNKKREQIISQGLREGKSNYEISTEANCSLATVLKRKKALVPKGVD